MSAPGRCQCPAKLQQHAAELEDRWRARLGRVTELSLAYHDAAQLVRQGSAAERSRAARRARRLARAVVAERQALVEIEAALDRITRGQYGRCEQCREPISAELLARHPQARYCTACGWLAVPSGWLTARPVGWAPARPAGWDWPGARASEPLPR